MQVFLVAIIVASALAHPTFNEFKTQYNKVYSSEMEGYFREHIYLSNLEIIDKHNSEHHSWTLGVNQFADLLHSEFAKRYLSPALDVSDTLVAEPVEVDISDLPVSIDWRTKHAVTGVKSEGECGACWAFSALGALEGQLAINTGKLVPLSEENLVACSDSEGNSGCDGGFMTYAYDYIIKNKGIDTAASYPFTSSTGRVAKCQFNSSNVGARMTGYYNLPKGSETALLNYTATVGPISVAFNAMLSSFQLYKSGIYSPKDCVASSLNFAMVVVGYGVDNNVDYWILKNDFGTTWGMEGYMDFIRSHNNTCGIASMASVPTGVDGLTF